jgi:tetratricopeptide (TPR) repeat protein
MPAAEMHPSRESGDDKWFWPAYDQALGQMYVLLGDNKNGISNLEKAAQEYFQMKSGWAAVRARGKILDALVRQGKYAEANRKFIQFCQEVPDPDLACPLRHAFRDSLIRAEDKGFELRQKVVPMLKAKQFAELDKLEDDMLASKRILASGVCNFQAVYIAMEDLNESNFDVDWKARIDLLNEWIKTRPDSATAKIALAVLYTDYAWKARGSGWSNTVSEEGWKLFGERLDQAINILNQIKDKPAEWYMPAQACGLGQGWPKDRYNAIVAECQSHYPDFDPVIFKKCYWLQPRWHGAEGEAESYLAAEANKRKGAAADILYARAAWGLDSTLDNIMNQSRLSWLRVKAGMKDVIKEYPKSLVSKGELSILALEATDLKTAEGAFDN